MKMNHSFSGTRRYGLHPGGKYDHLPELCDKTII